MQGPSKCRFIHHGPAHFCETGSFLIKEVMDLFNNKRDHHKKFEIVIAVRDKDGNPTGKKKSLSSEKPEDLSSFIEKNKPRRKKKKRNRNRKNIKKEGNS